MSRLREKTQIHHPKREKGTCRTWQAGKVRSCLYAYQHNAGTDNNACHRLKQTWLFLLNFTVITVDKTADAKRAALLDRDSHSVRESDGNPVKHIRRGGRGRAERKQTAERGCRLFSGGDGRGGTQLTDTDAVTGKPKTHTMVVYMSFTAITTKS